MSMRQARECRFRTDDGTELFYRHWPADRDGTDRAIVLFHRGHEHSGRLQHLVDELDLPGFAMFAWDARGHGHSPGPRGYSPSLGTSVKDVDRFVEHLAREYGIATDHFAVVAQSVGAVLAATWVHDYAPNIRCLVLASPAFKVKLYVPLARTGLGLMRAVRGPFYVNSYVKARFLTHDPERIASYEQDPLIARPISVDMLLALYETAERIVADARVIRVPTQLLISGADWVVHQGPQHAFFDRLGSEVKEKHVLDGFFHDTLGERDRRQAIDKIRAFILRRFEQPAAPPSLLDADRQGPLCDEFDRLAAPLPPYSPKRLYFSLTRAMLRAGARLSHGLRLGEQTGYDSGSTLDYVYRNRADGITPLGRLIDRVYLDSIGWRGIRIRKRHLERLIAQAVRQLRESGQAVRIVDIAAGHGRYVLDALAETGADSILLRDYSDLNVEQGRALIAERGLEGSASFARGDAFDRASLAGITPRPTLGIVSGLYELFPENEPIRQSLAGLAAALEPGGYLVYTNQPWHPQLELIARALTSHRGRAPWVMRRRSQAEMDQLVAEAGFEKLDQLIDDWGIFSVSLARRKPSP